ncbi:MAG: winged helix-turn-helix transcriptional regulator [Sciscionella sp.]
MTLVVHDHARCVETDDIVRWYDLLRWQQGKWVPEVVLVLIHGPARFLDLSRAINIRTTDRSSRSSQLSNSQLSRTLQTMHRDELVIRTEDRSQVPHTVTYELSPLFRDFLTDALGPATGWLRYYDTEIKRIRAQHRS